MKIHVFTQFYRPKDEQRWDEVRSCLEKNASNPQIDVLHVLYERKEDLKFVTRSRRIAFSPLVERLTYSKWLNLSMQLDAGDVSLLINSDIYLDETLTVLRDSHSQLVRHKVFLALTRYNPVGKLLLLNKNPHWTQDVWGLTVPEQPFDKALLQETAFDLGQPGCDNKIAYVMHSYGFRVTNPCRKLRSIHLHAEETRRYDSRADKLIGLHAFVHPSETPGTAAKLDIELLSRAAEDVTDLHLNNWINRRPSFRLSKAGSNVKTVGKSDATPAAKSDATPLAKGTVNTVVGNHVIPIEPPPLRELAAKPADIRPATAVSWSGVTHLKRHDLVTAEIRLVDQYSALLSLHEDANYVYYLDRGWPNVIRIAKTALPEGFSGMRPVERFVHGFARQKLDLYPYQTYDHPQHPGHIFYWQQPARTEQDAWDRLADAAGYNSDRGTCNVVIGLPWATFIDQKIFPDSALRLIGERVNRVRHYLHLHGVKLRVHTVCQHIFWRQHLADFITTGVTDLWIAHKLIGEDRINGLRLHGHPLFPVNVFDPERSIGLERRPIDQRQIFASFTGAFMPHYISEIRKKLMTLSSCPGYRIELKDQWHFNRAVYEVQISAQKLSQSTRERESAREYNELLSSSKFSLCPSGAGPNSIRLWEALGAGSVPVILADSYELPRLTKLYAPPRAIWSDAVIIHPESQVNSLDQRLRAVAPGALRAMQNAGAEIHKKIWQHQIMIS